MPAASTQLRNLIKITKVRKEAVTNLSDVLRVSFCFQQSAPACGMTDSWSQCFQIARVANFPTSLSFYSCGKIGRESSVHSACSMQLRMFSELQWILTVCCYDNRCNI